jgi:hypothetical protein
VQPQVQDGRVLGESGGRPEAFDLVEALGVLPGVLNGSGTTDLVVQERKLNSNGDCACPEVVVGSCKTMHRVTGVDAKVIDTRFGKATGFGYFKGRVDVCCGMRMCDAMGEVLIAKGLGEMERELAGQESEHDLRCCLRVK